jgi:SAM-dependent methyltransferase
MHYTALKNCKHFFDAYSQYIGDKTEKVMVADIGSQDVNGSLKSTLPSGFDYVGVDFVEGKGVDVVITDPYKLPFPDGSFDVVLSSSCFEHSEMFWLVFLEIMRVLKPNGLFYLNAPSNGAFHRWPVDCWRFYPDSGNALVSWAKKNNINAALLESYTGVQELDLWNDFVAVFIKDENAANKYPRRILDSKSDVTNGLVYGSNQFINYTEFTEDQRMKR